MRKRTKRKVYALVNPILHAIVGAAPPMQSKLNELRLVELSSIEAFVKGKATLKDWQSMSTLMAVAEVMAKRDIGKAEVLPVCAIVENELIEAAKRFEATGRMGLTGVGLQAIRDLHEYHDLQRSSVTQREYEEAILHTYNRLRSQAPDVKIIK